MARKRKTLPKDFEEQLTSGTFEQQKAVFDRCELDATGGLFDTTALGFYDCPDELMRWLVAQGADPNRGDKTYGRTALFRRAQVGRVEQIPLLLSLGADIEHRSSGGETALMTAASFHKPASVAVLLEAGADPHATDNSGRTALQKAIDTARNANLPGLLGVARLLVAAGAPTAGYADRITEIGAEFEFHRDGFNPDFVDQVEAALAGLHELFGVAPVAARRLHDGVSPITVPEGSADEQFEALWEALVPSKGASTTVQGEVVRIVGRVSHELMGNGGANWDRDFRAMLVAFRAHLAEGVPLSNADLAEASELTSGPWQSLDAPELERLRALALAWVQANPTPIALAAPRYRR